MRELGGDDAARDLPRRGQRGRLRRHGAGQQVPARAGGAEGGARRATASTSSPAGIRPSCCARDAEDEIAALRPHLDLLKAMGSQGAASSPRPRTPSTATATKPLVAAPGADADGEWAEFGARHDRVRRCVARPRACALVYHHHMGTVVEREADIDALHGATGAAVHLLLDTGHATLGGADPARARARATATASAMSTPRTCARDVMARAKARGLELPRCGARGRLHRAGRRHASTSPRCFARAAAAIPAGSSSRPSRTRKKAASARQPIAQELGLRQPASAMASPQAGSR